MGDGMTGANSVEVKASKSRRRRLWRFLAWLGWRKAGDDTFRHRLYRLSLERHRWWDWGHRVMILTGSSMGGNYQQPTPNTIWYRWEKQELVVARTYRQYRDLVDGMVENDWKWIGFDQDDELRLGYYQSGTFYGLPRAEQRLLFWWLVRWGIKDWFGFRTWLYLKALHAAVEQKIPFTCQAQPPRGYGYNHWHCQLRRRHSGMHRFNNYVFGEIEGEAIGTFLPPPDAPLKASS